MQSPQRLVLRERAKLLFGSEPQADWYVFPHGEGQGRSTQAKNRRGPRVSVKPNPTQPMRTWRTAWRSLTRAIQCPECDQLRQPAQVSSNEQCKADVHDLKSPLRGLRFHDLRHHAITELAESVASMKPSCPLPGTCRPGCSRTIHTSDSTRSARHWTRSQMGGGAGTSQVTSQNSGMPT